jgi:AraC-like DNA-binding protein
LNPLSRRLKGLYHRDFGSEDAWDIIQLISDIQKFGERQLPTDGVIVSVNELFDQYWRQHREDSFYNLLNRDKLLTVVNEKKSLSLNDARKLCFRLGISLFDLMSGNAIKVSQSLGFDDSRFFPKSFLHASVRVVKDHKFFLKKLKELNESDDTPMSLKATAKALGVSIGYLEYRFPAQVRLIVDRHQSYLDQDHLRKVYLAQTQALQYFLDISENRVSKSRKHAYKQLREETGLPKWVLKKAIQTAYQAIASFDMRKHMIV